MMKFGVCDSAEFARDSMGRLECLPRPREISIISKKNRLFHYFAGRWRRWAGPGRPRNPFGVAMVKVLLVVELYK